MNNEEKNVTVELNQEGALVVAKTIIGMFDGVPARDTKTMLNGITIAMVQMIRGIKDCCDESETDGIEKMVLSWLAATDPVSGLNFSKYIIIKRADEKDNV